MAKIIDTVEQDGEISEEENKYELTFENRKYKVKFYFDSKFFLFTIFPPKKANKPRKTYYLYRSKIENLKKNSEILELYYNNSNIALLIKELFNNNKIYLDRNENNKKELNLVIKLIILNKEEILVLPLEKKKKANKGYIVIENELKGNKCKILKNKYEGISLQINHIGDKYNSEFDNFNKEIKEIKNNNKYLNRQINFITNQISELNEKLEFNINNKKESKSKIQRLINKIELLEDHGEKNNDLSVSLQSNLNGGIDILKKVIKKKEEKNIEKLRNCFIARSNIIKNGNEIDFIINRLDKYNPISYELIYSSSSDGDKIKTFHNKCDGENYLLVLIKTTKGYIFGGFTSIGFDSSGFELNDDNAFLFSIDKQKIYDIVIGNAAVYCNSRFGPIFCSKNGDNNYNICIGDNFLSNISTTSKNSVNYKMNEEYELNFGEREFFVNDLEIYKLILVNS